MEQKPHFNTRKMWVVHSNWWGSQSETHLELSVVSFCFLVADEKALHQRVELQMVVQTHRLWRTLPFFTLIFRGGFFVFFNLNLHFWPDSQVKFICTGVLLLENDYRSTSAIVKVAYVTKLSWMSAACSRKNPRPFQTQKKLNYIQSMYEEVYSELPQNRYQFSTEASEIERENVSRLIQCLNSNKTKAEAGLTGNGHVGCRRRSPTRTGLRLQTCTNRHSVEHCFTSAFLWVQTGL